MRYTKEELEYYIFQEKLSYEKIGSIFNVSGTAIKKAALKYGLELPPRRVVNPKETFNRGIIKCPTKKCEVCGTEFVVYASKRNKYCSIKCSGIAHHKELYQKVIDGDPSIMRGNYSPHYFKNDILEEQGGVCAICGMCQEWNGKKLVFVLDHIDGNAANNKRDNLRCVCPNCDSQLDTYKSKNKNGARSYYRYHKDKLDFNQENNGRGKIF